MITKPARKTTPHRGLRLDGGDERKGQRHPDRALALAFADGERLDGLGGVVEEFVEPTMSVARAMCSSRSRPFGVNHAETHMREGKWPEATEISGIECAGLVKADRDRRLVPPGRTQAAP